MTIWFWLLYWETKVAGETYTNNLTPGSDYDYYDRRNKQQIETEIISGLFDKYGFGGARSKSDKQIKATIIEKIFGTKSQTEISKMNHELLKKKRLELEEMFTQLSATQPENVIAWVMSYHIKAAA